jgi:hypothetical protein
MAETLSGKEGSASSEGEQQPISVEEQLLLLEKANRLNRLFIFLLALLLLIILASLATAAVVKLSADKPTPFDPAAFAALQQHTERLEQQLAALTQEQAHLSQSLRQIIPADAHLAGDPALAAYQGAPTLKIIGLSLLGQEQSLQQSLQTLKSGMRDLAVMIPGSRSWLDDYNEELNKIYGASVQRSKAIQQWASKQPPP